MKKDLKYFLFFLIFIGFISFAAIGIFAFNLLQDGILGPTYMKYRTYDYVRENRSDVEKIFTQVFDKAAKCDSKQCSYVTKTRNTYKYKEIECTSPCHENIKKEIYLNLKNQDDLENLPSTYFIRVKNDQTLEKLFLNGEYKEEKVDTAAERRVVQYLQGKRDSVNYVDLRINEFFSNMIYLIDYPSEAELVIRVQGKGTDNIGAIVRLYGD